MSHELPTGEKVPIDSQPITSQPTATYAAADCCPPARDPRIASFFDDLTRQRTSGGVMPPMQPVSRRLFENLSDAADFRPTLLELGCGSGALTVALLESGAERADGLDLSPEAVSTARRRADAAGVSDRSTFEVGDAARVELTAHDWVVMDRVICCYPDVDALLGNAISAARKRVAFSVPISRGVRGLMTRFWWGVEKTLDKFRRSACPGYVHSLDLIEGPLNAAGFKLLRSSTGWMWYVAVWERAEPAA